MSLSKLVSSTSEVLPDWISETIHSHLFPTYNYVQPTGLGSGNGFGHSHGLLVDWSKKSLWAFVAMTAFNPIFWNNVARNEYRNKSITKIVGSPLIGTYILAITIFSISAFRDHLYINAIKNQPAYAVLAHPAIKALAAVLFLSGQTFVLSSMWALGVTGTYLGDYFGILMTHRVTSFPFNVLSDPMYVGSALSHLGTALWYQSPVGVVLAAWVWLVYAVALRYEGPFTDKIYSASSKKSESESSAIDAPGSSSSTPTSATFPSTPSRRSGRIASRKSFAASDLDSSDADGDVKSSTATPGRKSRSSALRDELANAAASGVDSPRRRSTRSRSKGRVSEVDTD